MFARICVCAKEWLAKKAAKEEKPAPQIMLTGSVTERLEAARVEPIPGGSNIAEESSNRDVGPNEEPDVPHDC